MNIQSDKKKSEFQIFFCDNEASSSIQNVLLILKN